MPAEVAVAAVGVGAAASRAAGLLPAADFPSAPAHLQHDLPHRHNGPPRPLSYLQGEAGPVVPARLPPHSFHPVLERALAVGSVDPEVLEVPAASNNSTRAADRPKAIKVGVAVAATRSARSTPKSRSARAATSLHSRTEQGRLARGPTAFLIQREMRG